MKITLKLELTRSQTKHPLRGIVCVTLCKNYQDRWALFNKDYTHLEDMATMSPGDTMELELRGANIQGELVGRLLSHTLDDYTGDTYILMQLVNGPEYNLSMEPPHEHSHLTLGAATLSTATDLKISAAVDPGFQVEFVDRPIIKCVEVDGMVTDIPEENFEGLLQNLEKKTKCEKELSEARTAVASLTEILVDINETITKQSNDT